MNASTDREESFKSSLGIGDPGWLTLGEARELEESGTTNLISMLAPFVGNGRVEAPLSSDCGRAPIPRAPHILSPTPLGARLPERFGAGRSFFLN